MWLSILLYYRLKCIRAHYSKGTAVCASNHNIVSVGWDGFIHTWNNGNNIFCIDGRNKESVIIFLLLCLCSTVANLSIRIQFIANII